MNMFFKNSVKLVVVTLVTLTACAQTTQPQRETEDLIATPIGRPADVPGKGLAVLVNQSTQMIFIYKDGQVLMESICGTGAIYVHPQYGNMRTPNSSLGDNFSVVEKPVHYRENGVPIYENRYGVKMPYAQRIISGKGYFIHASASFTDYKGEGLPQSAGCIRVPIDFAKTIYETLNIGTPVVIIGNPGDKVYDVLEKYDLLDLYDGNIAESLDIMGLRMKISKPGYTFEDVMAVRKALREGKLKVGRPDNTNRYYESYIGFPMFPKSAGMSLPEFDRRIRTKNEKFAGVRVTDLDAGPDFKWVD